jgi:MYXO-CTERM domain-containing protein
MRVHAFVRAGIGLALCLSAGSAVAWPGFEQGIPNGNAQSCIYCHVEPAGGPDLLPFGVLYNGNPAGTDISGLWGGMAPGDADNDGETNGQELGDPCGVWTPGATPEHAVTSNPSDPTDQSGNPPCANPGPGPGGSVGAGPAPASPAFTSGICAVQGAPGQGGAAPAWAWAALGAAALAVGRRARRRTG